MIKSFYSWSQKFQLVISMTSRELKLDLFFFIHIMEYLKTIKAKLLACVGMLFLACFLSRL